MRTLIMKFGGAAFETPASYSRVAALIERKRQEKFQIVAVVSAMGDMTDRLIAMAHEVSSAPSARELDMLISTGERISMSLLAMALGERGVEAVSFTGSQAGIITSNDHTEARIVGVRPVRLPEHLEAGRVVVVAGFQGVSEEKEITTLGRGGSDTTAVALGVALNASAVEFYKDVGGIFERDPTIDPDAKLLPHLTYAKACEIVRENEHAVLHPSAIELAARHSVPLYIRSLGGEAPMSCISSSESL